MGVSGVGGPSGYRPITETTTTTTATTVQAPTGPDVGKVVGDTFRKILDPLGVFSAVGGNENPNQWMSDKILKDVTSNAGARQAYQNYNWQGRNDYARQLGQQLGNDFSNWLMQRMNSGSPPSQGEIEAFMGPRKAQIDQAVNAQFGTPPANPDASTPPAGAYNFAGRGAAEQQMTKALGDEFSTWLMGRMNSGSPPSQAEIDGFLLPRSAANRQKLDAQFGPAPQILQANPTDPNYDYARRNNMMQQLSGQMADQIMQMGRSGASPQAVAAFADQRSKEIEAQVNQACGVPNPPPAYSPANDTPELFANNRYQMEQQIQLMQQNGTPQDQIQAYALQRKAELAQIFPKQSMQNQQMDEWKAVAQQMSANGKSEAEIREYLNKKTAAYTEPTAEELTVFSQQKAQEAQQIQQLVQAYQQQQQQYQAMLKKKKQSKGPGYW